VHQTLTVTVPGTYDLTWFDNAAAGNTYTYYVNLGGTTVDISGLASTGWTKHELSVYLSGDTTLAFDSTLPGGSGDALLDNVQLQPVQRSVPDSGGTFGLLNLALGGMAVLGRRLRRH